MGLSSPHNVLCPHRPQKNHSGQTQQGISPAGEHGSANLQRTALFTDNVPLADMRGDVYEMCSALSKMKNFLFGEENCQASLVVKKMAVKALL